MDKDPFVVEGLAELHTALRELPDSTAKNVLRRVGTQALKPIAEAAARRAPVERGALRTSIHVGTRLSRRQRGQHQKAGPDDVEVFAGAGVLPQAHLQEFGSSIHPAQPFLRPAWDEGKDRLMEEIKRLMWVEIQKAAERLARKAARGG